MWGRSWAEVVREAPGVELVAVADPDPEARRQLADGTPGYEALKGALAGVECEAVLVLTPPATHHAVAKLALEAGKHVLVEKPLATGLEDGFDLIRAAERAGRVLMVSQNYRYNRPFRAVQRLVTEGTLGELASIKICCRRDTRTLFPPDDFRYSMRHPYVLDMSIHHFDLLRAATDRDVHRIHARSWRVPDSPFVHHPAVAAIVDLEGGVPVVYEGTWASHGPETAWNGDWEVMGEAGRLLWSGDREDRSVGEVMLKRWGAPPRLIEQPGLEFVERAATLRALRVAVETGELPETAAADNIKSLAAMLACTRSIESGAPVDVSDLLVAT